MVDELEIAGRETNVLGSEGGLRGRLVSANDLTGVSGSQGRVLRFGDQGGVSADIGEDVTRELLTSNL